MNRTPKHHNAKTASGPKYIPLAGVLLLLLSLIGNSSTRQAYACLNFHTPTTYAVQVDGHSIKTEVVGTEAARQKGLSGRPCIKDNQAMLFVFETNDTTNHCFWMKDMRFAIDMVWLDANKRVVYRVLDVQPNTYPHSFCPGLPTRYVLEVKAHTADKLGLAVGTRTFF